jgi:ubiquinone/menaquinone biosynthesis C-methylase UbiE
VYHRYSLHPFLAEAAQSGGSKTALDLGCGTGVVSVALAERGFTVIGVDHSPEMLEIARHKAREAGLADSCSFEEGDVRRLRFADGEFGIVTCQGLLHHLEDMQTCLAELERVLEPGGRFYISEPCREETAVKRLLRAGWRLFKRRTAAAEPEIESVEEPISSVGLRRSLDQLSLEYEIEHLTHLPPLRRRLSDRAYLLVSRAVSFPWRRRKGDLVFVLGRKSLAGR